MPWLAAPPNRPHRWGRRTTFVWSFADQILSSITNFGLSLLAGRLLGPTGLGKVFLAFSIYLIILVLQRSLVSETLLAITSALDVERRAHTASLGLTLSLMTGFVATMVVAILGSVIPGTLGGALLLVAPWLGVALLQDYWRSLLFRERRAVAAALNDGTWLVVMAAAVPLGWTFETEWAVMAVWGFGACAGALLGFRQTRLAPARVRSAWIWWRKEAWPFGKWNAAAAMIWNVGSNGSAFVIGAIVGTRALGGLRAVESLFAPLSLIAPAVALPGLPAVARAYAAEVHRARTLATQLSGIAVGASLVFFAVLFLGGWKLLPFLFGSVFVQFREIIPAIAAGQVFAAAGVGYPLLLKVQQRGRFLLMSRLIVTLAGLGLVAAGAAGYGLIGAAWGTAAWALISTIAVAIGAFRQPRLATAVAPAGDLTLEADTNP